MYVSSLLFWYLNQPTLLLATWYQSNPRVSPWWRGAWISPAAAILLSTGNGNLWPLRFPIVAPGFLNCPTGGYCPSCQLRLASSHLHASYHWPHCIQLPVTLPPAAGAVPSCHQLPCFLEAGSTPGNDPGITHSPACRPADCQHASSHWTHCIPLWSPYLQLLAPAFQLRSANHHHAFCCRPPYL